MTDRVPRDPLTPLDPMRIGRAVTEPYHNRQVAAVNDHEIRLSVMTHGFPWHRHTDSDESFYCVEGELVIEFADREVIVKPGQLVTVPRDTLHRTRPKGKRSVNLTFEKRAAKTLFE